jgi:hypothetical protein
VPAMGPGFCISFSSSSIGVHFKEIQAKIVSYVVKKGPGVGLPSSEFQYPGLFFFGSMKK